MTEAHPFLLSPGGLSNTVQIFEVGPRDGLQNETKPLSAPLRKEWITGLIRAGLKEIEVGAMVREDRVPQMAATAELFRALPPAPGVSYWLLAPNLKGLEKALDIGAGHVSLLAAASDTFNQRNIGKTVKESLDDLTHQLHLAKAHGVSTRVYLSCAWHCPYEGPVAAGKVLEIVRHLWQMGATEIVVSDTIGKATPTEVRHLCEGLLEQREASHYSLHLHDTYGLALAGIQAALDLGFRRFDASAGGLGGCPYAKGASGNVATEDVVFLCQQQGFDTGVELPALVETNQLMEKTLEKPLPSKVFQAMKNRPTTAPEH